MLHIDIFSDLICPWCFIGKRRLDRVLAQSPVAVSMRWRAYQLRPGLPVEGIDRVAYLNRRYGPDADAGHMPERLLAEAREEQVDFAYEKVNRVPNTLLGHRLLAAAQPQDLQHELAERLFQAYFQEGQDVGDAQTLMQIARDAGMSEQQAEAGLTDSHWQSVVDADLEAGRQHDVTGVPCLIFAGRFPLPGVQSADVLEHFITRAAARMGG